MELESRIDQEVVDRLNCQIETSESGEAGKAKVVDLERWMGKVERKSWICT